MRRVRLGLLLTLAGGIGFCACVGSEPGGSMLGVGDDGGVDGGDSTADGSQDPIPTGDLSVSAVDATLRKTKLTELEVTVLRAATIPTVTVRVEGLPTGVTAEEKVLGPGESSTKLALSSSDKASFGRTVLTVRADTVEGGPSATTEVNLLVRGESGELDTSFGEGGSVTFASLGLPTDAAIAGAAIHDNSLFLLAGKNGGNLEFAAATLDGKPDVSRFAESKGHVSVPLPTGFAGLMGNARLRIDGEGKLVASALFGVSNTHNPNHSFIQYTLAPAEAGGTYGNLPTDVAVPSYAYSMLLGGPDGTSGYFIFGITSTTGGPARRPFVARRSMSGTQTWPSSSVSVFYFDAEGTETLPSEQGTEAFGISEGYLYLATAVIDEQIHPRIFIQPRDGSSSSTYRLASTTLTTEPAGTLAFSEASSQGDVFFSALKTGNEVCVWHLKGATPSPLACRSAARGRGVFPLSNERVAILVANSDKLTMHLVTHAGAEVPGWPSPAGVQLLASGVPLLSYRALLEDGHQGLLLVERGANGKVLRFWD